MPKESRIEVTDGVSTWRDPSTAHEEAGDKGTPEGWLLYIPDTCIACHTKSISKRAAEEAAQGAAE